MAIKAGNGNASTWKKERENAQMCLEFRRFHEVVFQTNWYKATAYGKSFMEIPLSFLIYVLADLQGQSVHFK